MQKYKHPNILLIISDQQSADTLSSKNKNPYLKTPAMDSLFAEGIEFTNAYCSHPLCTPSRTSRFSGRYPHETGVIFNDNSGLDMS